MHLEDTGERLLATDQTRSMVEHLHRYAFALEYSHDKVVLDIACGEGYGSRLLSDHASYVYAIDNSEPVILQARNKYQKQNLEFLYGSVSKIPLKDDSIDLIVCFETIEHVAEHVQMMTEFKRILKEDGILILSTPDKKYYSDLKGFSNPFHVRELYRTELQNLIGQFFAYVESYSQAYSSGSIICNTGDRSSRFFLFNGNFDSLRKEKDLIRPLYNLIIAGANPINKTVNSFFESPFANRELESFESLNTVLNSRSFRLGRALTAPFRGIRNMLKKRKN